MRALTIATTVLACTALAACQSSQSGGGRVAIAPPTSANAALNGNWVPTDEAARGIYVAEFKDGKFVSRSTQNGNALAEGNYTVVDDKNVDLTFIGAATRREVNAKCQRNTPTTLYCVPSVGSPFNLQRSTTS